MGKGQIIVAMDPFHPKAAQLHRAFMTIDQFAKSLHCGVCAVSAVSRDRGSWPVDFDDSWRVAFKQVGDLSLRSVLKTANAPHDWKTHVVEADKGNTAATAAAIAAYARETGAPAIAVTARHEGGHFVGGFINHLMVESSLPIFVVNEKSEAVRAFEHVLFATDLSESAKPSFDQTLGFAKELGAQVHLMNVLLQPPAEAEAYAGVYGGINQLEKFMASQEAESGAAMKEWLKDTRGVRVEPDIFYSKEGTSEAILSACRSLKGDVIFIHNETGPLKALLFGSPSRDVVRHSEKPVLLLK